MFKFKIKKAILFVGLFITACFGFKYILINKKDNVNNPIFTQKIKESKMVSPSNLQELQKMNHKDIAKLNKYDGRNYGIIPNFVENQGGSNLCWAYSTASASEISILRKGIQGNYNKDNLSFYERQIDYITNVRTLEADKLGLTKNDIFERALNQGGSASRAAKALSKWTGSMIVKPLHFDSNYNDFKKYINPTFLLQSYELVKTEKNLLNNNEIQKVKELVAKYGAVSFGHFTNYYNNQEYVLSDSETRTGHAATIIGWDDTISKDKFISHNGYAKRDGAWIVRNSYGVGAHNNGYFYLSFDSWMHDLVGFDYVPNTEYENNYFYDGIIQKSDIEETNKPFENQTIGVIFPTKKASFNKSEFLKGVMVGIKGENTTVKVDIYNNVKASIANKYSENNIPNSGQLVATKTQTFENEGTYTIKLNDLIELELGQNFSIIVSVKNPKNNASVAFSHEPNSYNDLTFVQDNKNTKKWKNTWTEYEPWVARIGALTITKDKSGNLDNNIKYADVKITGNSFSEYGDNDKPDVKVEFNGDTLKENIDYKLNYQLDIVKLDTSPLTDNTIIGGVQIIIEGINKYKGVNKSASYPLIVGKMPKIPSSIGNFIEKNKVEITVSKEIRNFNQVILPKNWKWAYPNESINNTQYLKYEGLDSNYYRTTMFDIVVKKENIPSISKIDISNAIVNLKENKFTYNGYKIEPTVSVNVNGNLLQNTDYTISYENNIEVGKGLIKIIGIGKYKGEKNIQFTIEKAINNVTISNNNGSIEAISIFGIPIIKYYNDSNCQNEIIKPTLMGKYYAKAYVSESKNWFAASSSIIEFNIENNISPFPPKPDTGGNNTDNDLTPIPPKPDNEINNKVETSKSNKNGIIIVSVVTPISLLAVGGGVAALIIFFKRR